MSTHGPHIHAHEPHHAPEPPAPPPDDPRARRRWEFERRWTGRLEVYIAVVLGLAAILAAVSAYRNEQHTHESTLKFNTAIRQVDDSNQFYNSGNTIYEQDRLVFLEYAKAINANDAGLADYLLTKIATPELRAGIKWWQGQPDKTAPPTPFSPKNPDYGIANYTEADNLTAKVGKNFEVAKKEQDKSDHFTLVEVILASALFLFGIAGVTRRFSIKLGTVIAGTAIFAIAIGFFVSA